MFELYERPSPASGKTVLATFPSFEEAVSYAKTLDLLVFEEDVHYPGCADMFTSRGRVLAIEPADRTLVVAIA